MLIGPIGDSNDYTFIDRLKTDSYRSLEKNTLVSVVIPYYERRSELIKALGALAKQTISTGRIQVIVSDDGSSESIDDIIRNFKPYFKELIYVRQENKGFRLSKVRNLGASHATGRFLVFLDCDVLPLPKLLEEHIKALTVSELVISVGFRKDCAGFNQPIPASIPLNELDWRVGRFLKDEHHLKFGDQQYRICSGGNIACNRSFWLKCKFDESFENWGGEDNEWGYRASTDHGAYIYPNLNAQAIHICDSTSQKNDNKSVKKIAQNLLNLKCPIYNLKDRFSTSTQKRPLVTFWICNSRTDDLVKRAVDSALAVDISKEVIIVDNNLNLIPNKASVECNKQNDCVRTFVEYRLGAHFAYERALKEAKGHFLIQLDADDVLLKKETERLINEAMKSPQGIVSGLLFEVDENLAPLKKPVFIPKGDIRQTHFQRGMQVRAPRIMRKRSLSRAIERNYYNSAVDFELYTKVMMGSSVKQLEIEAYAYCKTPESISNNLSEDQANNSVKILLSNIDKLYPKPSLVTTEIGYRSITTISNGDKSAFIDHLKLTPEGLKALKKVGIENLVNESND